MILGEVREARHREPCAVDAMHRERVRADLDRNEPCARIAHPREQRLELRGFRSGEADVGFRRTNARAGGADHAADLAGLLTDRLEQVGHCGLAVRAGDAEHRERRRRIAVEARRDGAHGAPDARHPRLRHVEREQALDQRADRAVGHGVARELVPVDVGTRDTAVQRAGYDPATVVGDVQHDDVRVPYELEHVCRAQEVVQKHGILSYGLGAATLPVAPPGAVLDP